MVWSPDDLPGWEGPKLTGVEKAWVEQRRREAEREAQSDRPSRSLPHRMRKAVDGWSVEAGWVAEGLKGATVTLPPAKQAGERTRRGSGPSDPTGAQLHATLDEIGRAAEAWAHLAGPCPRDGEVDPETQKIHWCPSTVTVVDVADMGGLVVDPEPIVDGLLGTPPSSPVAWAEIVDRAAGWHSIQASTVLGLWDDAWRSGWEPSELESWCTSTEMLARKMAGLAGRLAGWSGRSEPRCPAGCGGRAEGQGGVCGRCRNAAWRERNAESA